MNTDLRTLANRLCSDAANLNRVWSHPREGMEPYEAEILADMERAAAALEASAVAGSEPASWIDRWREADRDRRMALDALKAQRAITDEAIGILRTFRDRLDVHARVGVLGQLWLDADKFLGPLPPPPAKEAR